VKLALIDTPDASVGSDSSDGGGGRGASELPTRSLTPGEVEELRAHVARETRSFGWRTIFIAYWCWITARFIDVHLADSAISSVTPRAILLGVVGFTVYLWFRVPPLRALRRDVREKIIVRVPVDPHRSGSIAEVLRHSRRIWSHQGTPAAWRTMG
jgi:hypothetical protein